MCSTECIPLSEICQSHIAFWAMCDNELCLPVLPGGIAITIMRDFAEMLHQIHDSIAVWASICTCSTHDLQSAFHLCLSIAVTAQTAKWEFDPSLLPFWNEKCGFWTGSLVHIHFLTTPCKIQEQSPSSVNRSVVWFQHDH